MTYDPKPIDTAHIKPDTKLLELIKKLARNNHDVWARKRIEEGWSWGPERNDKSRTHPDLVPFEELSESEKDYDRESVQQTILALLAMGYRLLEDE